MKLHLPKSLLTAVLAACVAPAAWGYSPDNWDVENTNTFYVVNGDVDIASVKTSESEDTATTAFFLRADGEEVTRTITELVLDAGDTITIAGDWQNATAGFKALTIDTLKIEGEGKGAVVAGAGQTQGNDEFPEQHITIDSLNGKLSSLTINKNATVALGATIATTDGSISSVTIDKGGVLDLSTTRPSPKEQASYFTAFMNATSGAGKVLLGSGTVIQTAEMSYNGDNHVTLKTNYEVSGSDVEDYSSTSYNVSTADLTLQSWAKSTANTWRDWNIITNGSLTVGTNGKGVLNVLSGNRLNINGGSVTSGIIRIGHAEATNNVGAIRLTSDGSLKVGNILVQGSYTQGWNNKVELLDGEVEFTSQYAISYSTNNKNGNSNLPAVDVVLGGSGEESLSLVANTDWTITKNTHADSSFNIGNIVVKNGNTGTVTLNNATLTGAITNNAKLALGGTLDISATGKTITNAGTLDLSNLTSINIHSFKGLSTTSDFTLSDGENGLITQGGYILVQNNGGSVTADGVSATLAGYGAYTISNQDGTLTTALSGTYMVNTEVSYNNATMESVSKFWVDLSGTLNTTDASMLNKVQLEATSSQLYYQNTAGDDLLRFSGTMGSAGLNLSASNKTVTATGDNSGFTGDITVLSGTTLKAANNSTASAIFGATCETTQDRTIRVQNNATLDVNGSETYYRVVLEGGATLANYNSNADVNTGWKALPYLKLEGNATISATSQMVMQKKSNSSHENKLILGGNTLTKTGKDAFIIKTGAIESNGGTIRVDAGGFNIDGGSISGNFNLVINGGYFQTGAAASVSSLTMGASAQEICIAGNTTTVSGVTTSEGVLKKTGSGTLTLNGAANLNGLNITNGTVNLNGVTTLGGAITLGANNATANLAVGESGSVVIKNLGLFSPANGVPATNGLVTDGKYKVVTKNTANSTHNLNTVTYYGDALTLDADGYVTGGSVYYAVEQGTTVNVGGDHATNGTADAAEFYVGEHGHLSYADTFGTTGGNAAVPTITNLTGTGKVSITLASASGSTYPGHHDNAVSISDAFKGTLEVSGKMNLTSFSLGKDAKLQLAIGEHWSAGGSVNTDILLAETKGAYEFRHAGDGTLTLNGEVSGKYLDVGTVNGAGTLKLTNAANDIENVTLGASNKTAHLTLAADMAFTSLTSVNSGSNVTLESGVGLTLGSAEEGAATAASTVAKLVTHANGNTIRLNKSATLNVLSDVTGGNVTLVGDGSYYMKDGSASSSDRVRLGQDWRGTAIVRNIHIDGIKLTTMGNADSTIKLQGLSGWITNENQYKTVTSDVILENYTAGDTVKSAMVITGHSKTTYAFQGAVSGSGDFELASNATDAGVFEFSGDTSGWTGGVVVNSASDGSANTPMITLQLIGGGDIFSAEENDGITVNRNGGTVKLQLGNTGKASTMHGAIVNNGNGWMDVAVNANTKNVTFNEAVNINGTLTVNGEGATLIKAENSVGSLDLSESNGSTGTLKLTENVSLNVSTNFWGGKNASVELEKGASLTKGVIRISGVEQTSAGVVSKLESTTKADGHVDVYTVGNGSFTISNADVTIASGSDQTIGNVLNNSSLINDGGTAQTSTGKVIADNQANSFVDVKAITGSIELMNLVNGGVQNLEVAAGKSVVATDTNSAKATVSVSGQATFGAGATLSANLTLASNAELVSVGDENGISLNGGTLTLGGKIGLGKELKGKLDRLTGDATLVLFTNVGDLTLNDAAVEAALLSARNSGTTSVTTADASAVFDGIAADQYTINLAQGQVFLSAMPVPEPTTSMLGLVGLVALTFRRRRK